MPDTPAFIPVATPTGPVMEVASPSAARPMSFPRGGSTSPSVPSSLTGVPAYSADAMLPTGRVLEGLPESAARPLSFLRRGGTTQPQAPGAFSPPPSFEPPAPFAADAPTPRPTEPAQPPAGAIPLSRTTEPAPSVRVTNVRRPEPLPPEPPGFTDEDARYYPEEGSAEGCASGDCIPDAPEPTPVAPGPVSEVSAPVVASAQAATLHGHGAGTPGALAPATPPAIAAPVAVASPATAGSTSPGTFTETTGPAIEPPERFASPTSPSVAAPAPTAPLSGTPPPAARPPFTPPRPAFSPPPPEPEQPEPEPSAPLGAAPSRGGRDNPNQPLAERWRAAVESVKASSARHGTALANGRLLSMRNGEIVLGYVPAAAFHRTAVAAPGGKSAIDKALAEHFGRSVKLTITDVSPEDSRSGPSIAEQDAQSRAAHEKSTEGKVRSHPAIRSVLKFLGGEIEHIQVYEPERPVAVPLSDTPDDSA